jgi:hypothetical protein
MATFIEIKTDAYAKNLKKAQRKKLSYAGVRRPLRGIEIKDDTYGILKVIKADGTELPLTDAGGSRYPDPGFEDDSVDPFSKPTALASTYNYSNFIIQRIDESRQEKSQILETFGDSYIFFFGERPRLLNVSGLLMNTVDFNWRTEFWYNYENVLRGTKLVEQNARIYLFWDDLVVEGYMLQAAARDDADMPYHIPFNFTLFVTAHTYLSTIGDENYPIVHAVKLAPGDVSQMDVRDLLTTHDVPSSSELKEKVKHNQAYISTIEAVREQAQQDQLELQAKAKANQVVSGVANAMTTGKNFLANALAIGLNAQNLTFLSLVNHFFKNRKMRFPKGIAGAEAMVGPPEYAAISPLESNTQRVLPYRSQIRDNIDEYVAAGPQPVGQDSPSMSAEMDQKYKNKYLLEKQCLLDLATLGLDPVQHPGGSPFQNSAAMTVIAATADIALFAAGTAGTLAAKPPTKTRRQD